MHSQQVVTIALLLVSLMKSSLAFISEPHKTKRTLLHLKRPHNLAEATEYQEITNPQGITIRYKEPGKAGLCETTGAGSYSGYIDLAPNVHVFFWFFESRRDPANDDLTLWLNGGPGSDSLIGLFAELGPCRITPDLKDVINPWSFNNVSNMLFLSQPVGTGFSYQDIANGSIANGTGTFANASQAPPTGTWPILDPVDMGTIDTTDLAAKATWHILQAFLLGLPCFKDNDAKKPKNFNLWTESYGGHYGPAFFEYFYNENAKIKNGTSNGYPMNYKSLGIINAIVSAQIQEQYYYEYAVNNTYGIKAYNDTVYNYAKFANLMPNGCQDQIQLCIAAAKALKGGYSRGRIAYQATSNPSIAALCSEAASMCRDNVEGVYYSFGGRGVYDIRHPLDDPTPTYFWADWLNQPGVQQAIGVSVNYTDFNADIYYQFQSTGDWIYPNFLADLKDIVNSGVRVALIYGDADYICNWFGGEAVSFKLKYKHHEQFLATGYEPFVYEGTEYGETREYGNFSFTRIYESGHTVPYYQPQAAFALFNRIISGVDVPSGTEPATANLTSNGSPKATHTEASVALPPTRTASLEAWSSGVIASFDALDTRLPAAAAMSTQS